MPSPFVYKHKNVSKIKHSLLLVKKLAKSCTAVILVTFDNTT